MPLTRPRFTVRRLMVAVAIVAVVLGVGIELELRHRRFDSISSEYNLMSLLYAFDVKYRPDAWGQAHAARQFAWHKAMSEKYRRAARYPFLPVPADPPKPE